MKKIWAAMALVMMIAALYSPASAEQPAAENVIVIKNCDVYVGGDVLRRDVTVDLTIRQMTVKEDGIKAVIPPESPGIDRIFRGMVNTPGQAYIFLFQDEAGNLEVVKFGHCPKGEAPPDV